MIIFLKSILLLFLFSLQTLLSSEGKKDNLSSGFSIISNFPSEKVDNMFPQNWCIVSDSNNILYFGNLNGVFLYDGVRWENVVVPNKVVRSLVINQNQVLVGAKNNFGLLSSDPFGRHYYTSLSEKYNYNDFSNVFKTFSINEKIYFQTRSTIYEFADNNINKYTPLNSFRAALKLEDDLYIQDNLIGLKKLNKNTFELVEDGKFFNNKIVISLEKLNDHELLVGTYRNGLFVYRDNKFISFNTEIDELLKTKRFYRGIKLSDGNFALATLDAGLFVIDKRGELLKSYYETNGLLNNDIKYIFQDYQNNIWLALNNGISKIEYSSPFEFYDKRNELDGIILSLNCFDDNLYVGTSKGLFKNSNEKTNLFETRKFQILPNISGNIWQIIKFEESLIIVSGEGIYEILNLTTQKISNIGSFKLLQSKKNLNLFFASTKSGFEVIIKRGNKWELLSIKIDLTDRISDLYEDNNELWLSTYSTGVYKVKSLYEKIKNDYSDIKIDFSGVEKYDSLDNLPNGEIKIFDILNYPLFTSTKGIFRFDNFSNKFIPDSTFGTQFADGSRGVFQMAKDKNGNVWIHSNSENFLAEKQYDGSFEIISKPFRRLEKEQVNVIYPDGDFTWLGTNSELIRFDSRVKKNYDIEFNALVRKVYVNTDSLIYGGAPLPQNYKPLSLNYDDRNVRFQYAATFYEAEERTEYQYKLEGYDENWSEWTKETQKDYTNLSEGNYIFNIRAKNVYGNLSNIDTYKFKILPPIYRTFWAYLIYASLFLSFGYVITKWRINQLEKDKQKLSSLVDEKTKEVKKQSEKLKELDKIKSRFFANISHEFRTPLTLIIGPTEQMFYEEKSDEKKNKFSLILRNSKKLLSLINQLLDLSKLESGKIQLNINKIDIIKLVKEITSLFESVAKQKNIKLDFKSEVNSYSIYCDLDKLEKVFVNLLFNAFKFTNEKGNISVTISTKNRDTIFNEDYVNIVIYDTGIGITEDKLKNIFDPFYQADGSTKRKHEGTGIGLSIAKEFIELHGGTINVESTVDVGTKFTIQLPKGEKHIKESDQNEILEIDESQLESVKNKLMERELPPENNNEEDESDRSDDANTILIVEDNPDVRFYIKDHLQNQFTIYEAENGLDGIEKANEIMPDLIISDVMMPEMNGYKFCEKVKSDIRTSHIPVILLTAKASDESVIKGLDKGADDYITKPFNISILSSRVKNLIKLRQQLQQKIKNDLLLQPSEIKVSSVDDDFLKKLHDIIEENISNPDLSIEELSEKFFMSRIHLFRKIKALTGEAPSLFLRSYRLKRATQLLKQKSGNITEIAFQVGFSNSAYFTKCFREQFHQTPSEFISS